MAREILFLCNGSNVSVLLNTRIESSTSQPQRPSPNPNQTTASISSSDQTFPMSTAEPETDRFTGTLPPDPLLQSGCFIDPSASNGETPIKESEQPISNGEKFQASGEGAVASPPASAQKRSSNGEKAATLAPDSAETKRRRRTSTGERRVASGETPDWLPPGWIVEDRVRASGATAGSIDKVNFIDFLISLLQLQFFELF